MDKRVALAVILVVMSSSAVAEWVAVGTNNTSTLYVDYATVRKAGERVKMWDMLDFKAVETDPRVKPYRSSKSQYEYDCKEEQVRLLFSSNHSGPMGTGETVDSAPGSDKWGPVPPQSAFERLWKIACGK